MASYIYMLSNQSMPGVIKVGMTNKRVSERAKELQSTGVPTPFVVEAYWEVPASINLLTVEQRCHNALTAHRISNKREFFEIGLDEARSIISALIPTPEHVATDKARRAQEVQEREARRQKSKQQELEEEIRVVEAKLETNYLFIEACKEKLQSAGLKQSTPTTRKRFWQFGAKEKHVVQLERLNSELSALTEERAELIREFESLSAR